MSSTACAICRWPVRCILTEAGQRLFVDPVPDDLGTIVRVELPDYRVRGHILTGAEMPWLGDVNQDVGPFALHMKTCGRQGRPKPRPRCDDCGAELHPIITARGGRRHWLCGPAPKPQHLFQPAAPEMPVPVQPELSEAS